MCRTPRPNTLAREPIEHVGVVRAIMVVTHTTRKRSGLRTGCVNRSRGEECQTSRGAIDYDRDDASAEVRSRRLRGQRRHSSFRDRGRFRDRSRRWRGSQGRIGMRNCLDCVRKEMWEIENDSRAGVGRCEKNYFLQVLRSRVF
jgi:hypothetical protein